MNKYLLLQILYAILEVVAKASTIKYDATQEVMK